MRWSRRHLVLSSGVLRVQWLFAFACVLTRTCVSASVTTPVICGTSFVDTASSAYLAEVVLEGRVREKINGSGGHFYNISIQLRKNVLKGKDLVNGGKKLKKLTLGKFFHAGDNEVLPEEVSGSSSGNDCVGHVEDGATYIFFLRNVGDKKGKYFEISAKPVKSSRQTLSTVTKAIGPKGVQKPVIQHLRASPNNVTVGNSVTLRCKAKAKPNPEYAWTFNGNELNSVKSHRITSTKRESKLVIQRTTKDHAGKYECIARNVAGSAHKGYVLGVNSDKKPRYTPCEQQTFCFNGGNCTFSADLQERFCKCPESYEGSRCEKEVAHPSILRGEGSLQFSHLFSTGDVVSSLLYERSLIIIGIAIAVLVFAVICIASFCLANRRRKTGEAKRRMKMSKGQDSEQLLKEGDFNSQSTPSQRPMAHKETQIHPSDFPHTLQSECEPNFTAHSTNTGKVFQLDKTFPTSNSSASVSAITAPSAISSGHRVSPVRQQLDRDADLERKCSRSRLRAVNDTDDNCNDRPSTCKGPGQHGVASPEEIELNNLSPLELDNSGGCSSVQHPGSHDNCEAAGLDRTKDRSAPFIPSPRYELPIALEPRPTVSAFAEMKNSGEKQASKDRRAQLTNGQLSGEESDSEGTQDITPLHSLHINEENFSSHFDAPSKLASFPLFSHSTAAVSRPNIPVSMTYIPGISFNPATPAENDDSLGSYPLSLSNNVETTISTVPDSVKLGNSYAFVPYSDSEPDDINEQFMHRSPPRGAYSNTNEANRERYLRDVRESQNPVRI